MRGEELDGLNAQLDIVLEVLENPGPDDVKPELLAEGRRLFVEIANLLKAAETNLSSTRKALWPETKAHN